MLLLLSTTIRQVELTQTRSSSILETVACLGISLQRQLFGRLATLGIIGDQVSVIPETTRTILNRGVSGTPHFAPRYAPRGAGLSDSCKTVRRKLFHVEKKHQRWGKFCNINDTLKWVIGIPVNWHISTDVLTKIARAVLVIIHSEMCHFGSIVFSVWAEMLFDQYITRLGAFLTPES